MQQDCIMFASLAACAGSQWDHISTEAKQCIKTMLAFKPSKRATAAQLLQKTWFKEAAAAIDKVG